MLRQYAKAKKEKKKEIIVPEFKEDIIDANDAARAFLAAEMKAEPGEPYNICSGKLISSKEIAEALSNYDNAVKINFVKVRNAKEIIGDNRKFFRTTGWRPVVEIDASVKGIIGL
jgi:nucleoside-diphosphate-sugar epimerase